MWEKPKLLLLEAPRYRGLQRRSMLGMVWPYVVWPHMAIPHMAIPHGHMWYGHMWYGHTTYGHTTYGHVVWPYVVWPYVAIPHMAIPCLTSISSGDHDTLGPLKAIAWVFPTCIDNFRKSNMERT